jgi:hypothetical protein
LLDGGNEDPSIPLHKEYFTPSNIASLLKKYNVSKDLDVLSVDADYDDFYITREILLAGYTPRVLINEYNVNFGSEWSVSVFAKPVGKEGNAWKADCYFGVSAMALISLVELFGYTPVFANHVNFIFVRLDQAQELGMIIPSVDNFPGPFPRVLHRGCSGKTWKLIDSSTLKSKATDKSVSHVEFAEAFRDITLLHQDYGQWRIFTESSE